MACLFLILFCELNYTLSMHTTAAAIAIQHIKQKTVCPSGTPFFCMDQNFLAVGVRRFSPAWNRAHIYAVNQAVSL